MALTQDVLDRVDSILVVRRGAVYDRADIKRHGLDTLLGEIDDSEVELFDENDRSLGIFTNGVTE